MNTTNVTLGATRSYHFHGYNTSVTNHTAGSIQTNNVGHVFGKVIRLGLGQLMESFQNFWKRKPSAEEIAYRRQGDVYLRRLKGFVERLDADIVNIGRNPNDRHALKRIEKFVSENSQFINLHEREDLRGPQEMLFKGLTQRVSRMKPNLQQKLKSILPSLFRNIRTPEKTEKKSEEASLHENKHSFRDVQNERAKRNPDTTECQQSFDLQQLGPGDGAILEGDSSDLNADFGQALSSVGDINNDGKPDFAIGVPNASFNGTQGTGKVIFIYGGQNITSINFSNFTNANGIIIYGQEKYDGLGSAIALVGDINDDGRPDVGLGAAPSGSTGPGKLYVLFPPITNPTALGGLNGSNGFMIQGEGPGASLGACFDGGGDLNGDNIDDMVVGAPGTSVNGLPAGKFYGLFGQPNSIPWPAQFNVTQLNGTNGFTGIGNGTGSILGCAISMGTANGNALADFSVANPNISPQGAISTPTGMLYTFYGRNGSWPIEVNLNLNGTDGFVAYGALGDYIASSVLINGGKGNFPYLVIGTERAFVSANSAGKFYLLFKRPDSSTTQINLASVNSATGTQIEASSGGLGSTLTSIDINNDGFTDLVLGIPTSAGQVAVILGDENGLPSELNLANLNGTNGFFINGPINNGVLGQAVANLVDMDGNGIEDLGISAPEVGNGTVYIINGWNAAQCPPPTTTPTSITGGPMASLTTSATNAGTSTTSTTNEGLPTTSTTNTASPTTSSFTPPPPSSRYCQMLWMSAPSIS